MNNAIISRPITLFDEAAMATDLTSVTVNLQGALGFSVEASWATGSSLDGSILVEVSNSGTVWVSIWTANVSGATGSVALNVERSMFRQFRVTWDRTAGTGDLSATANIKAG